MLASALLQQQGFASRRFELAFLFGSFQPDCNPFSFLKGSLRARLFRGHNFSNSKFYIHRKTEALRRCSRWRIRQYYTLGKLTHYLADAFTYPHNDHFPGGLLAHHRYETSLRLHLAAHLFSDETTDAGAPEDLMSAIERLHQQYMASATDIRRDTQYILQAADLLMRGCAPATFVV